MTDSLGKVMNLRSPLKRSRDDQNMLYAAHVFYFFCSFAMNFNSSRDREWYGHLVKRNLLFFATQNFFSSNRDNWLCFYMPMEREVWYTFNDHFIACRKDKQAYLEPKNFWVFFKIRKLWSMLYPLKWKTDPDFLAVFNCHLPIPCAVVICHCHLPSHFMIVISNRFVPPPFSVWHCYLPDTWSQWDV